MWKRSFLNQITTRELPTVYSPYLLRNNNKINSLKNGFVNSERNNYKKYLSSVCDLSLANIISSSILITKQNICTYIRS